MKIIDFDGKNIDKKNLDYIVSSIKKSKVVALPTDTIYGLSCIATSNKAIEKVKNIKGRKDGKAFLIMVSSLSMLSRYVYLNKKSRNILSKIYFKDKRPTTVILKHRNNLPKSLYVNDTIAVRLPKSKFLIKMIREIDSPIISTSLNLSGKESVLDPAEIKVSYFKKNTEPDILIDAGKCRAKKPSKLVSLSDDGKIIIIRK